MIDMTTAQDRGQEGADLETEGNDVTTMIMIHDTATSIERRYYEDDKYDSSSSRKSRHRDDKDRRT